MGIFFKYLENIAEINNLDIMHSINQNRQWIFHHGMLFSSCFKWWENHGKRKTLHEGVDILYYKNKKQQIQTLDAGTLIPSATDGKIINICDDFIGQSIVVQHNISFRQNLDLLFIYAHILPDNRIQIGTELSQGEIIASIANTQKKQTTLLAHLHFSVIEVSKDTAPEHLNWEFFSDRKNRINLINPLFI